MAMGMQAPAAMAMGPYAQPVAMAPGAMAMGPGVHPGMMPQAMVPGQQYMAAGNGMQMLAMMPGLDVQERARWLQEATALLGAEIEMANKYRVLDQAGNQLFYAVEKTDCCRRQCQNGCCQDCVSWEVDVLYTPPGMMMQPFLHLRRPFQCVCCCFNRPTADVIDMVANQKLGSFRDPCTCCSLRFQVRDEQDADVLLVDGGCCCSQPGIWCPLPCGPCSEVNFTVEDVTHRNTVAHITKRVPGALQWLFAPDVDNYHVTFDQVQDPRWKAILLAFTVFMDFRYFNTNRNQQNAQADN